MIRWPAEWEPQDSCYTAWPTSNQEWSDLTTARTVIQELAQQLSAEKGFILASNQQVHRSDHHKQIHVDLPYGDVWCRDIGPLFVTTTNHIHNSQQRNAVAFRWTGWGGKFLIPGDEEFAAAMAARWNTPLTISAMACEGGALDTDGNGTVLTTAECLLSPMRNPGYDRADVEAELNRVLGTEQTIWLERGLLGDHTDGHVDNLARFVAPGRVVCATSENLRNSHAPNAATHRHIRRLLEQARDASGSALEVMTLPSPPPLTDPSGQLLPASYLNFVITNNRVCVPIFDRDTDDEAIEIIAALFPRRQVVGVFATPLLYGGGALHCVTNHVPVLACQQVPTSNPSNR